MSNDGRIERLREIRESNEDIDKEVLNQKIMVIFVDDKRVVYYLSEMDSAMMVLDLLQKKAYKEAFILIRTIFEKFLYFWLMLEGRRYRWTVQYTITPKESQTVREARDKTYEKWLAERKAGKPNFADVIDMNTSKAEDVIIVTYEREGLFDKNDKERAKEPVPYYGFMLDEYNPQWGHLTELPTIIEGDLFPDIRKKHAKTHKMIYHQFFYIDNIYRNLRINSLISEKQEDMIRVHYNFLSRYVHPGKEGLQLRETFQPKFAHLRLVEETAAVELVTLYVAKLMHLYLKVLVAHYGRTNPAFDPTRLNTITSELESMSKNLWFFDNEPTEYDRRRSIAKREEKAMLERKEPEFDAVLYHENPLQRIQEMMAWKMI